MRVSEICVKQIRVNQGLGVVIKTAKNKYRSIVIRLVSDFFHEIAKKFSINRHLFFFLLLEIILCRCPF